MDGKLSLRALFYLLIFCGCVGKGARNWHNAQQVSKGMTGKEVVEIMGPPNSIDQDAVYLGELRRFLGKDYDSIYYYTPPFAASDGIYFYFKNDLVVKIISE
ncbi:MAG: hypothetical protein H6563_10530 [Lewinellaceae bacterium]|nr:hypothetical protein [Lewinellaceae bacterium]